LFGSSLAACGDALAGPVGEWNVQLDPGSLVRAGVGPTVARSFYTIGRAQLYRGSDGSYSFRIQSEAADDCFSVEGPALVEKTPTTTTITPGQRFPTCQQIRLVINNDGSGGYVQSKVGKRGNQTWATDEDHVYGLTPR